MKKLDIRPIIKAIKETVESHELSEKGTYCRWLWQDKNGTRKLGINEYGCADAMNILYTINDFHCDEETRKARVNAIKAMQNEDGGMFTEATHHTIHTTAHCTAAIELFDEKPLYPITYLHQFMTKDALYKFLEEEVNWNNPWPESHKGAGIYAALVNAGEITEEFQKNYFDWMWENADSELGFWKSGIANKAPVANMSHPNGFDAPDATFAFMAGGFHYMFNHEYAKMPLRYPEKIIDACIYMYENDGLPTHFGKNINFIEVDWVYCMNRASRQTTYKHEKVKELLEDFAVKYVDFLSSIDYKTHDNFNDLHMLFGATCALAELQAALPGKIITEKPLRLVLERRPFI